MPKFRKRPVIIEAWQWKYDTTQGDPPAWLTDAMNKWPDTGGVALEPDHPDGARIAIATLEGVMTANPGDYITQGIKGEICSCKPDIFEMAYEEVID